MTGPIPLSSVLRALHRDVPTLWWTPRAHGELGRLHAVLFFAQGHHLAQHGEPLFLDPIVRTVDGVHLDLPDDFDGADLPGEWHYSAIGQARDRYAHMVMTDLRTLLQATTPWQRAAVGDPIDLDLTTAWFRREAETDDPHDERPNSTEVAEAEAWLASR